MRANKTNDTSPHLKLLGENIKIARLTRAWSLSFTAAAAVISINTLIRIESGDRTTSIGLYEDVLNALGMANHLEEVGSPLRDVTGREISLAAKKDKPKSKPRIKQSAK